MAYLMFLVVCITWGGSFILMKKSVLLLGPISVAAFRIYGGAIVLTIFALLAGRRWRVSREDFLAILLVALIGYAWPYAIQPYLVGKHGSAFIGLTVSFTPLLTLVVSIPILRIYPTMRQLLGVVGGLLCMAIIMAEGQQRSVGVLDALLALSVPLSYSVANAYTRKRFHDTSPLAITISALALAGTMLLPLCFALPSEHLKSPESRETVQTAIVCVVILGTLGTGIGPLLFTKLVVEQGPLFAGMVTYIVPIGALAWGWLDSETITPTEIIALVGIFAMVGVVQYGAARSDKAVRAIEPHPDDELV
jgi:drug/metabolite transporter (DMT)-like permease